MERRGRDSRPGSIRTLIPRAEDAAGDGVTVYKKYLHGVGAAFCQHRLKEGGWDVREFEGQDLQGARPAD
jgi:hypothetical protein